MEFPSHITSSTRRCHRIGPDTCASTCTSIHPQSIDYSAYHLFDDTFYHPPITPNSEQTGDHRDMYIHTLPRSTMGCVTDLWHFQDRHTRSKFRYTPQEVYSYTTSWHPAKEEEHQYEGIHSRITESTFATSSDGITLRFSHLQIPNHHHDKLSI